MASTPIGSRNPVTLTFLDPHLEREFQMEVAAATGPQARVGSIVAAGLWLVAALIVPAAIQIDRGLVLAICGAMVAVNIAAAVLSRLATSLDNQQVLGVVVNGLAGLAVLALIEASGTADRYAAPALLLIAIFAFVVIRLRFVFAAIAAGTYLIGFVVVVLTRPAGGTALDIFLVSAAIVVGLAATYLLERSARDVFVQRRVIESQAAELTLAHATSERLLLNVLPESVAERLKSGETTIADGFDDATVLFADLVGFTPLAASLSPAETVGLLDRLFSAFDLLADRHGLEKIKTIGDAYMVVGGVPVAGADHPERAVAMGLDMLDAVGDLAAAVGRPLEVRIGIHTGPLVAGVIGTRKFIYDLWGDTVNIASRLESHGIPGAIQISDATWSRVRGTVTAKPRGPIELKGRGTVETFVIERRDELRHGNVTGRA